MDSCEDGPGRKAGLPTWGRVGQVRLGLWKEKKRLWGGGGSEIKEKSNRNTMMEVQREESSWRPRVSAAGEAA